MRYEPEYNALAHHGVKSQKWGEWNDETKRKYGALQANGGGVSEDDEEKETDDKSSENGTEESTDNVASYPLSDPSAMSWFVGKVGESIKDVFNKHLRDIQTGDIDREEACVIGIVNAAGISGSKEGLIYNPKAIDMGVTYGQYNKEFKKIK